MSTVRNIRIIEAEWTPICGHIIFRLNFKGTLHYLSRGTSLQLFSAEYQGDKVVRCGEGTRVNRNDIVDLIRQGDSGSWSWFTFIVAWEAWAAGYENGYKDSYKDGYEDGVAAGRVQVNQKKGTE